MHAHMMDKNATTDRCDALGVCYSTSKTTAVATTGTEGHASYSAGLRMCNWVKLTNDVDVYGNTCKCGELSYFSQPP